MVSDVRAQNDTLNKKRLFFLLSAETVAYSSAIFGLNYLWYKDYDRSSFHFFDDRKEWFQVDKAGHFYSSYYFNEIITGGFEWSGMSNNKSVIYGGALSFLFISSIEILDGFSDKWGASWSDLIANSGGILLFSGQKKLWNEQRIIPKFSFCKSRFAAMRPDALGDNFFESIIKDYNGQTYWLSFNVSTLTQIDKMPEWLNVAIGYGADGMLGGINNNIISNELVDELYIPRYRQYYVSLDIDLTKIKTNSKILKRCFVVFNSVKIPFPAVEISRKSFRFHAIFF